MYQDAVGIFRGSIFGLRGSELCGLRVWGLKVFVQGLSLVFRAVMAGILLLFIGMVAKWTSSPPPLPLHPNRHSIKTVRYRKPCSGVLFKPRRCV